MATLPAFVLGPNTFLSLLGFLHGADRTPSTPHEDWRTAKVDVIIPTLNEEDHIVQCLAALGRQTLRPRRILLVDDGSTDATVARAEAFCASRGMSLVTIRRAKPIGKTPTVKRQARELDSDVEFILDGDTILESENYIERTVQELYQAVGIASACGMIRPLRGRDRAAWLAVNGAAPSKRQPWTQVAATAVTNVYREVLYAYLQRFVYRGELLFFGTTANPVGCAVAYRRKYLEHLFGKVTDLGDNLTNSEDIFIGMAMLNEGYRNIYVSDVYARTVEPAIHRLPKQIYLWSSSFLQSTYYFDPLVKSPIKAIRRAVRRRRAALTLAGRRAVAAVASKREAPAGSALYPAMAYAGAAPEALLPQGAHEQRALQRASAVAIATTGGERRSISEPYRQAFGGGRTLEWGRPAGWMLMMSAVEKVFFPTVLLMMMLLGNWHGVTLTVAVETLIGVGVLGLVMKGRRVEYMVKAVAVAPVRYALLATELVTLARFAVDLWITKDRRWRK